MKAVKNKTDVARGNFIMVLMKESGKKTRTPLVWKVNDKLRQFIIQSVFIKVDSYNETGL